MNSYLTRCEVQQRADWRAECAITASTLITEQMHAWGQHLDTAKTRPSQEHLQQKHGRKTRKRGCQGPCRWQCECSCNVSHLILSYLLIDANWHAKRNVQQQQCGAMDSQTPCCVRLQAHSIRRCRCHRFGSSH